MGDCSKTEVFFKEYKRMCKSYLTAMRTEKECEIHRKVNNCGDCMSFINRDTEKAIEIVQEWSDQHPVRTRLSVFKEQYPNCAKWSDGRPKSCVGMLYVVSGCVYNADGCKDCWKCWNTPVEESENNG